MKTYLHYVIFFLVFVYSGANAQQVFKVTPTSKIGFLEYLPSDYNSNSNKYPIVLFLHGMGERGPSSDDPAVLATGASLISRNGPPKHVEKGTQFPFILISPQLKSSYGDWPTWYVMEVLDYVKTYLRIDPSRIYLTGLSLGGGGVWWTAQDHPDIFAAIAPVCGSRNTPSKACLLAAQNLPVWAFHGDKDGTVPLSRSVTMVNAINACQPAPSPLAKMTIYPGVNHNAWDNAYMPDHSVHNPNIYEWMLSFKKGTSSGSPPPVNIAPTANAGPDKLITLPTTSLNVYGSGSDPDGNIVSYSWSKVSGPGVTLGNITSATLNLSALLVGDYVFRLTVKDNAGAIGTDDVKVTVQLLGGSNQSPTANAGADKTITLPTKRASFWGMANDPDGSITNYTWSKVSGGQATLYGSGQGLTVDNLVQGVYVFRLTVKDNGGATATDDVKLTVNGSASTSTNEPPVVNAGADQNIVLPTNKVTLWGSASDPDGNITTYTWTKTSGGAASLYGTDKEGLTVDGMVAGTYSFRLTVKDNSGATASDNVTVTVQGAVAGKPGNQSPSAYAGSDRTLILPTNKVALWGMGADPDGYIVSYSWSKISGGQAVIYNSTSQSLSVNSMVAGTYVFRLTVTDDGGWSDSDDVTINVVNGVAMMTTASSGTDNVLTNSLRIGVTGSPILAPSSDESSVEEGSGEFLPEKKHFDLSNNDIGAFEDCMVVIFDEHGNRIYAGEWKEDSFRSIFTTKGLYFYHIAKEGYQIDSGKIFITQ